MNSTNPAGGEPVTATAPGVPDPVLQAEPVPPADSTDAAPVGARYIWLQVLGQFGVFLAFITPIAISLSIKVNAITPGRVENLGYITGIGALVPLLTGPIFGRLSDLTRTRWGRRRPWIVGGVVLGLLSLVVMAWAPSIPLLAIGWMLAQLGWGQALGNIQISMADRLPESQRGKVAGLAGFATQIAPTAGVVMVGRLVTAPLWMFLVPGVVGGLLALAFAIFIHEDDMRGVPRDASMNLRAAFGAFVFNPVAVPDYSLMWLSRFFFYLGLTLSTTYTTFFFASRLGIEVTAVAGIVAALGGFGVLATSAGAMGGGFLSDKIQRRRVLVLIGGIILAMGAVTQSQAHTMPLLFAGSLLGSLGLGLFAAVDQALMIDVLPNKSTEAGRFMSIAGLATSLGQTLGPFLAPVLILTSADGSKDYTVLYLVAGGITFLAGAVVMRIRSVR